MVIEHIVTMSHGPTVISEYTAKTYENYILVKSHLHVYILYIHVYTYP